MAEALVGATSASWLPEALFVSSGVLNVFVPSGGGQWAVQGPLVLEACHALGVPFERGIMAMAFGDELTNMLQPFWALPLLGITGLSARDILPYTLLVMAVSGAVMLGFLAFGLDKSEVTLLPTELCLMTPEFQTHVLPNGLRVIHAWMPCAVTHCALAINAGTRDEAADESGLAHFIEHVLFKGTQKRKAFHILNRMESVGGEINAYTTKEDTWITSSQRVKDTERALELLADIAFHSVFPEAELDKERDVILDEIASVQDQPGDMIFESFEAGLFAGHALAAPILGTADRVKSIDAVAGAGLCGTPLSTGEHGARRGGCCEMGQGQILG